MNSKKTVCNRGIVLSTIILTGAILGGWSPHTQAGTFTWNNGAGGSWFTAANWNPNSNYPQQNDIAEFNTTPSGSITYNNTVNIGAFWLTSGSGNITIQNDNAARTLNLYGSQTINSVANVGVWLDDNLNKTLTVGQASTYNTYWVLQNSQKWYIGTGNTFTQNTGTSGSYLNLNGKTFTIDGGGTLYLTRLNNSGTMLTGTVIKQGSGIVYNGGGFSGRIDQLQLNGGGWVMSVNWLTTKFNNTAGIDFTGNSTLYVNGSGQTSGYDLSSKIKIEDGVVATINTGPINGGTATSFTYASAFQVGGLGTGGLTKAGAGTLTLSAANTYSGATTINGSTLALGSTGSIGNSATIDVQSGAFFNVGAVSGGFILGGSQTLKGNGTVVGNVLANGTVSPGNSAGTLTFSAGSLTLAGTTLMQLDKGATPQNDLIWVSGQLLYGGTLTVTSIGASLAPGDSFNLFDWTGSSAGSFATLTLPTLPNAWTWDQSQLSSLGIITVIPEPSTLVLVGFGLLGVLVTSRRFRRSL